MIDRNIDNSKIKAVIIGIVRIFVIKRQSLNFTYVTYEVFFNSTFLTTWLISRV